jgi:hypothetical protein
MTTEEMKADLEQIVVIWQRGDKVHDSGRSEPRTERREGGREVT